MSLNREVRYVTADDGTDVVLVPLGENMDDFAVIDKNDYDYLLNEVGITGNWIKDAGNSYVRCNGKRVKLLVARVLMDAGKGQVVRYRDGNPLNLRGTNLRLVKNGLGRRRERDFLPTSSRSPTNA